MSNFRCEICGKDILDTPAGYITECEHYPLVRLSKDLKKETGLKKIFKALEKSVKMK